MSLNVDNRNDSEEMDIQLDMQSVETEGCINVTELNKQANCSEQAMDNSCTRQETVTKYSKVACATGEGETITAHAESIVDDSVIIMNNGRVGNGGTNPVLEVDSENIDSLLDDSEKFTFDCSLEKTVNGAEESPVITTSSTCGTHASEPSQGPAKNCDPVRIEDSETCTGRNGDSVNETDSEMDVELKQNCCDSSAFNEFSAMVQQKSKDDDEFVSGTALEAAVALNEETGANSNSTDSFKKPYETRETSVFESQITTVLLEPTVSDPNCNSLSVHRGAVVPYSDTDDSDTSSSSSSCDDSSDESGESETSSTVGQNELEDITPLEKSKSSAKPMKVNGELDIENLPPIQDLHISVRNDEVSEIGKVLHAVDTLVVVEGYKDLPPLDIDSVLFLDRGARPLGRIFDVMGPVTEALYCVRFNSKEHIEEHNIQSGMLVYCAPQTEHSNFVFLQHLLMMKGSDASWKKDTEVPPDCLDFSDDEEEAKRKKALKTKKAERSWSADGPEPKASKMGNKLTHPPNSVQQFGQQNAGRNDGFRPRNPWGWSGARTHGLRNEIRCNTSPINQGQFPSRGSVRPSSFNADSIRLQSPQNYETEQFRYPRASQFGRGPDTRMFGQSQTDTTVKTGSSWCATPQRPHPQHQDMRYPGMNPGPFASYQHEGNEYPNMSCEPPPAMHCSGTRVEDHRYHAFQSEISRLVDAYNRGAEAPTAALPPHFNGRQSFRPHLPTGLPPHVQTSSVGPPPHYARRQLVPPSRFPAPPPPPPPHHTEGPNSFHQNYYPGQW